MGPGLALFGPNELCLALVWPCLFVFGYCLAHLSFVWPSFGVVWLLFGPHEICLALIWLCLFVFGCCLAHMSFLWPSDTVLQKARRTLWYCPVLECFTAFVITELPIPESRMVVGRDTRVPICYI